MNNIEHPYDGLMQIDDAAMHADYSRIFETITKDEIVYFPFYKCRTFHSENGEYYENSYHLIKKKLTRGRPKKQIVPAISAPSELSV